MRLLGASIEGFRAFTKRVEIDLSADITILVGPNGTGKTSLLDSILWGLTGRLKRLSEDGERAKSAESQERIVSLYAPAGLARVALMLGNSKPEITVIRTLLDGQSNLVVHAGEMASEGPSAVATLLRRMWDSGASSASPLDDLHEALTRSVYLQQDLVRQFVDRDSSQDRFAAISQLTGVGRIDDLQRKLESSRNAWHRAMTQRDVEALKAEQRLAEIRAQLTRIGRESKEDDPVQQWNEWWKGLLEKNLGIRPIPEVSTPIAGQVLEQMLRTLQASQLTFQRRLSVLPQVRDDLAQLETLREVPEKQVESLKATTKQFEEQSSKAKALVAAAEEVDARARAEILAKRDVEDEMHTLAQLALRHLSSHCPVCAQSIDMKAVERRLRKQIARKDESLPGMALGEAARLRVEAERVGLQAKKAQGDLDNAIEYNRGLSARRTLLASQLADLDLGTATLGGLNDLEVGLRQHINDISEAYSAGEALSLAIAKMGEEGKREELLQQEISAEMEAKRLRGLHASYQSAYDEATNVIEAIRDVADDAVNRQIERIAPLLQKIYTRIDPHPAFRVAELRSKFTKGRGRVDTPVLDPRGEKEIDKPAQVFSSAQTGALAVSIFLAMNLASDGIPLHTAILDDPLQSLDDINVLGMLDALRRIRERRQLIISTHDEDFAALLRRKFRPLEVGQRTSLVTLRNWERSGVSLEQSSEVDIPPRLQVVS